MAVRCFCGCGEKVPRSLRSENDRGRALRQRQQDLQSLIDGGMKSPRAEQFIGVMNASGNVLAHSIHHKEPLTPELDGRTGSVLVLYERLFGDEALGRAARLQAFQTSKRLRGFRTAAGTRSQMSCSGRRWARTPPRSTRS
jgi:hypothetical protein